jgi:hypothetical protein
MFLADLHGILILEPRSIERIHRHPGRQEFEFSTHDLNRERGGERWRRTPGARIRKQTPPTAIRSTEKLN